MNKPKSMTVKEKEFWTHFTYRSAMYIAPVNKETITAFVHGYAAGNSDSAIIELLGTHLEISHRIPKLAMGWPWQVEQWAEKRNIAWEDAFAQIVKEMVERHGT